MYPDPPLYERDPEAWNQHLAEGNATQPRKRVGVDVLIRDEHGRLLLVDPHYKPGWDLPGGMSEANESPSETARRELTEELGLEISLGPLLCLEWVPPHAPWDDSLMFIFDGGTLTTAQINHLEPHDKELAGWAFVDDQEAASRLGDRQRRRLAAALQALSNGACLCLQDGEQAY
jgi:8-oxo-dGTP pyrophosphatase MutT (NUDIX family)